MTQEEKAKAYDEAFERAKKLATDLPNGRNDRLYHVDDLEYIFPELKESEDESIRKYIIQSLKNLMFYKGSQADIERNNAIAWFEKQKLAKWSEKDEAKLSIAIDCCERGGKNTIGSWLKSLRPRNTWKPSEDQMKAIEHICDGNYNVDLDILDSIYRDFKKLRKE